MGNSNTIDLHPKKSQGSSSLACHTKIFSIIMIFHFSYNPQTISWRDLVETRARSWVNSHNSFQIWVLGYRIAWPPHPSLLLTYYAVPSQYSNNNRRIRILRKEVISNIQYHIGEPPRFIES